ncbi:AAA family ATPase [Sandarakinorhabdus limnophila]|uniref:AAA family ATPase n=1 Tax=Sandarakinorhabdus limnophila TaxID=210512 RepID=UPI0026EA87A5|nr:AAA family ATPase [Sandarakinorhabdus limnophila]
MHQDIAKILGGPFIPPHPHEPDPPEVQLADAMKAAGIEPPARILLDGKLRRFDIGRKGDKSGWLIGFSDGIPAGRFGDWKNGIDKTWCADFGRALSPVEQAQHASRMAEAKKARDEAKDRLSEAVAGVAETIWECAKSAGPDHPYLARKGVAPHGVRVTDDGRLMVPLYTSEGVLASVQYINGEGGKRFHSGAQTKDCWWIIGEAEQPGPLFIAEGFATAATIVEVMNRPCVVAFNASNLPSVAKALRAKHGRSQELVIVADNDEHGVGRKYADKAASLGGARVVIPPTSGQDANDYRAAGGDLRALLEAPAIAGNKAKPSKEFHFVRAGDLSIKKPEYLIDELLETDALSNMFGAPGDGKSFIALEMALCIATGTPFHGRAVKQGPVFIIVGEGIGGLARRMAAWSKARGVSIKVAPLFLSSRPAQFNDGDSAKKVVEAVHAMAAQYGAPALIEIDTLARNFGPGDENQTKDMVSFVAAIDNLKAEFPGCAAMIVHHSGHADKDRARGSIALKASLEGEYRIQKDNSIIKLTCTRMKDGPLPPPITFELKDVEIEDGISSAVLVQTDAPVKKERLNNGQRVALHAFTDAATQSDQFDDDGQFIGITEKPWREVFCKWYAAANPDMKPESVSRMFRRLRADLVQLGRVSNHGDLFMVTDPGDLAAITLRARQPGKAD